MLPPSRLKRKPCSVDHPRERGSDQRRQAPAPDPAGRAEPHATRVSICLCRDFAVVDWRRWRCEPCCDSVGPGPHGRLVTVVTRHTAPGESACEPVTAVEAQSAAESHVLFGADPASEAVDHRNDVVVRNGGLRVNRATAEQPDTRRCERGPVLAKESPGIVLPTAQIDRPAKDHHVVSRRGGGTRGVPKVHLHSSGPKLVGDPRSDLGRTAVSGSVCDQNSHGAHLHSSLIGCRGAGQSSGDSVRGCEDFT